MTRPIAHMATTIVTAAVIAFTFAACNTVAGAGKDVKSTGKAIERTAEDAK